MAVLRKTNSRVPTGLPSNRLRRTFQAAILLGPLLPSPSLADDPESYFSLSRQVQTDLDAGKSKDARDRLDRTTKSERSFAFAFTRDGRLLGWKEPAGFRFIDLGPAAAAKP